MDSLDIEQLNEKQLTNRLMDESVSLQSAREAMKPKKVYFGHDKVTDQQVKDEMTHTMMNCTTIKPCGE